MGNKSNCKQVKEIAAELGEVLRDAERSETLKRLPKLELAAKQVGKAFSGSWLGYHSLVYYADFVPPPPSAVFSPEYGLMLYRGTMRHLRTSLGTMGDWQQYSSDEIKQEIFRIAGTDIDLDEALKVSKLIGDYFEKAKTNLLSILEIESKTSDHLSTFKKTLQSLLQLSTNQLGVQWAVPSPPMSRDSTALTQGRWIPPHVEILAELATVRQPIQLCEQTATIAENIATHLERLADYTEQMRQNQMAHEQIQIDATMNHNSSVNFNEKKDRYEATATTCKHMGYGKTQQEALAMLEKIVSNKVRKRPELENLDEHEAYDQKPSSTPHSPAITNVFNVHGVVNTGTMQQVTVSVHQSIANLQHTQQELATNLNKFVSAVETEKQLPEPAKLELLDRADTITVEASKPVEKRMIHKVTDNLKGIGDTLKGVSALKGVWDVVEPVVKTYFGL